MLRISNLIKSFNLVVRCHTSSSSSTGYCSQYPVLEQHGFGSTDSVPRSDVCESVPCLPGSDRCSSLREQILRQGECTLPVADQQVGSLHLGKRSGLVQWHSPALARCRAKSGTPGSSLLPARGSSVSDPCDLCSGIRNVLPTA